MSRLSLSYHGTILHLRADAVRLSETCATFASQFYLTADKGDVICSIQAAYGIRLSDATEIKDEVDLSVSVLVSVSSLHKDITLKDEQTRGKTCLHGGL